MSWLVALWPLAILLLIVLVLLPLWFDVPPRDPRCNYDASMDGGRCMYPKGHGGKHSPEAGSWN